MTYKALLSMRRQLVVFAIAMVAYHIVFTFGMGAVTEPTDAHALVAYTLGGPADFVCFFALICGANIGLERHQHARVTRLLPLSQLRLALATFTVDIIGLVVAYAFSCALGIAAVCVLRGVHALHGGSILGCVVIPIASIVALYGASALLSVLLGHGRFVGPTIALLTFLGLMFTAPDVPAHTAFQWLNIVNPVLYLYLATVKLLGPQPALAFYRNLSIPEIATIVTVMAVASVTLSTFVFSRKFNGRPAA